MANESCVNFGNVSFKFNKINEKTALGKSHLACDTVDDDDGTEFIDLLEDRKIKSIKPDIEEDDLVIPLIKRNVWQLPSQSNGDDLHHQAVLEILQESNGDRGATQPTLDSTVVPLSMQNRIPQGFETEDRMDVSLRPDSSRPEDYERIPVNDFGVAMLRGMGWKPGMPIGLRNKNCVEAVEVVVRPKGLGLGANCSVKRPTSGSNEEQLLLVSGSFVCVESGHHRGHYGKVESLDEDTGRAVVRLTLNGESVSLPELSLRPVTKKEFQRESLVINKEKLLQQKEDKGRRKKEKNWVRPGLRVRFVDESYGGGKFFNTKMIVEEVSSPSGCVCRLDDSRLLKDISSEMLETVIPKDQASRVMVVRGRRAGLVGQLVERDKRKCLATVHLSSGKLLRDLPYDDICEVVSHR